MIDRYRYINWFKNDNNMSPLFSYCFIYFFYFIYLFVTHKIELCFINDGQLVNPHFFEYKTRK